MGAGRRPRLRRAKRRDRPMSLLKNFATVGSGTAASRVLGFIRDIFIAAALGAGPVAEAYFVAQRLPNLFRRIFAEGGFASAFVPLFTKTHEGEGADEARRFAEESLAALTAALIVVTVLAELAMTWLTFALAPGFAEDPAKFDLAVLLSRIAFPYLLLISLVTLLSGALERHQPFRRRSLLDDAAQPRPDCGARLRLLDRRDRHRPCRHRAHRRHHRRRCRPIALPLCRLSPGGADAEAPPAAPDARRDAPGEARRSERDCRRHRADQHRRRHDHRLAPARRGIVALLRRPSVPAAARHRRHRHRHRAPARPCPGAARRPRGRRGARPEPRRSNSPPP